jgi:hypothetical protein
VSQLGQPPDYSPLGARLAERLAPLAPDDSSQGYALGHLCEALASKAIQLQEAFDPVDAASFETILDPARCPAWALPWLAQLAGLSLPTTADEATQRALITALAPQRRGTPAALEAAASLFLTGSKTVFFRERDPSGADPPYTLEVVTVESETPDPAQVLAALMAAKPAGIVLTYRSVLGWDYQAMTDEGASSAWTYASLPPIFPTYRAMTENSRGGP